MSSNFAINPSIKQRRFACKGQWGLRGPVSSNEAFVRLPYDQANDRCGPS